MRKGKNVIGQSVVSLQDGRKVDSVKDLLLNQDNDAILGLLVDEGGLLSSSRVVPIEGIYAFGRDAVVIRETDAVISASADPEIKAIINRNEHLLNKRVMTNTGDNLGHIGDMYFEEATGRITGFEVSGGMLGDIARGTSHLAVTDIERMGLDVVFVRPETADDLLNQKGGLEGAMNDAGQKIGDATDKAASGTQAAFNEREPEKSLIGRRSGQDVADSNGSIVVANGQRIRPEHVEWAKRTDNMGVLTRAATAGQAADLRDKAGAGLEAAGDSVASMWDRFTQSLSEQRDEEGKRVEEWQIKARLNEIADAIGRPVGKVILDRSDNVILDFGDIITHQAVQQAYDSGMLETLLATVYRADFGLPLDQLRAEAPATATVEKASGGAALVEELEQKVQQTDEQRAQEEERQREESQKAVEQREREREQRARARESEDTQRQRETEQAKTAGTGDDYETIAVESPQPAASVRRATAKR
ncbi:MAG TPA: PRC-barrel domain-containing protein [Candidatus Limnocylindria bacterium]|nr:PRC-barrel domain-containing protein [Candidatus Limnocylindria bacterium]